MSTILIVDDSAFSRGRVWAALANSGHRLIEAVDGQAGLDAALVQPPDLIVSDLLMPNLDGFGLLRGLRERGSEIPVIVVSADIQATSKQLCQELGASAFLNKPFQASELMAQVRQLLPAEVPVG